jgi:hypothetical protein
MEVNAMELIDGRVETCLAEECSYNCADECCAPKIVVGKDHPACDTYTTQPVQRSQEESMVGQCAVQDCHFNDHMSCDAAGITVLRHSGHADCGTYRA